MGARKLQAEIDRVFKKVNEGVADFDDIADKIKETDNSNQREKFEQDLKKEIKKLQRYRDSIKAWIAGTEVKNKTQLVEVRKLIESRMEQFKATEKESKTKAFSKEGLQQLRGAEPPEKVESRKWINKCLGELQTQIDSCESRLETEKGRKKKDNDAITELEERVARHRFHVEKLELILRRLENEDLTTDDLSLIRDGVEDYIERNEDADFLEDEELYDALPIQLELTASGVNISKPDPTEKPTASSASSTDAVMVQPMYLAPTKKEAPPPKTEPKAEPKPEPASSPTKGKTDTKQPAPPKQSGKKVAEPARTAQSTPAPPVPAPNPVPSAAAAAPQPSANNTPALAPAPQPIHTDKVTPAGTVRPSAQRVLNFDNVAQPKAAERPAELRVEAKNSGPTESTRVPLSEALPRTPADPRPAEAKESLPGREQKFEVLSRTDPRSADRRAVPRQEIRREAAQGQPLGLKESSEQVIPDVGPITKVSLTNNMSMQEEHEWSLQMLESSLQHIPQEIDSERPKQYPKPARHPCTTPAYYPQQTLPNFDNPQTVDKFDTDTLFFIFYYQQGTYQQYLAARELKKQSWRYHKKYLTWFQRHEEPKEITNDYEQGTYVYFDYETGWCQRKKSEFTFEYRYLEDYE